jgi:thymidylate synthase (FAD)
MDPTPNGVGERDVLQSRSNKQGRDERAATEIYREAVERWERLRSDAGGTYRWLLEEDVAREIARIDLPVSMYTQWYWKVDLHNLLHFLTLRVDPRAQYEIRVFAEVIAAVVKRVAPLSYEAWVDYDLGGEPFSLGERRALGALLEAVDGSVRVREGAARAGSQARFRARPGRDGFGRSDGSTDVRGGSRELRVTEQAG